ncbi:MAG: hypothetical protein OEZ14_10910 [Acidimicrobiia bacterium]|nr:hypothetical protein [Acidimicrobiia bacterium]
MGTIANSVFMTYLWIRSGGSVLIAGIAWHFSINFWAQLMLSDISLKAASEDGVLAVVDPTLYGVTCPDPPHRDMKVLFIPHSSVPRCCRSESLVIAATAFKCVDLRQVWWRCDPAAGQRADESVLG